jgi:hypothetical protein
MTVNFCGDNNEKQKKSAAKINTHGYCCVDVLGM